MQSCEPNPESSYTKQYQKHEPSSFCYYIKCFDDEVYEPKLVRYTGEDAAQKFADMLEEDIKIIANIQKKKMIIRRKRKKKKKKRFDKETNVRYVMKSLLMILKIKRLETIVILLAGIEELHTTYVILGIENLILRL